MRILIISRSPWRLDNSFGNTYSSIFRDMKDVEIANIYLADGIPEYEPNVTAYYQVSEKRLMSSLKHPFAKDKVGNIVKIDSTQSDDISEKRESYDTMLSVGKKRRWPILFLGREFLWKFGKVDYEGMSRFVADFHPDIIFLPYYYAAYVFRVALYLQKKFNLPMTGEAALDIYSLKQLSVDPFYWINRFYVRNWIRKAAHRSASLYLISEKMRKDYADFFNLPCKILYKIPDFSRLQSEYKEVHNPVRFLFTGNIGANRWKTLGQLASALKKSQFGHLDIYTGTPITSSMRKVLDVKGYSEIHDPVSQEKVKQLQNEADILVHAESFNLADKLLVRYSISTKIMDYLCVGRAIFALGPKDVASIEYLCSNDAALVATNNEEIGNVLSGLKHNQGIIMDYARKGLAFAKSQMNAVEMKQALYNDLEQIVQSHKRALDYKQ